MSVKGGYLDWAERRDGLATGAMLVILWAAWDDRRGYYEMNSERWNQ